MVTISDATIRQNVFETVYDRLTAKSFSTDVSPTISAAYISGDKSPYPQIILAPIEVSKDGFRIGPNSRQYNNKTITVTIDIFTKKNKDLDILTDEVDSEMDDDITGLTLVGSSESEGAMFPNKQKVRMKTITYTFVR